MAIERSSPLTAPLWSGRMVEWSILVVVLLVAAGVFGRQVLFVQGQGEFAAIKATVGALRTALVIDHLHQAVQVSKAGVAVRQRNPFLLLDPAMVNYAGEHVALQTEKVAPGSWVFDMQCECVGYLPLDTRWLEYPPNSQVVWFRIVGNQGPLQMTALEDYIWQGQPLN